MLDRWGEGSEAKGKGGVEPRAFAGSLIVFWNQEDAPGIAEGVVSKVWAVCGGGGGGGGGG